MCRPARTRDNNLYPTIRSGFAIVPQPIRCAVGRHNARLIRDTQRVQHLCRLAHCGPIRLAAHDDAHRGGNVGHGSGPKRFKARTIAGSQGLAMGTPDHGINANFRQ